MASSDKELEQELLEAGNKLAEPPSSVDQLLPLLDQVENCLLRVEQSPTKSMQNALSPSLKALVADQLFSHSNVDVRVAVASCISEITRITAPDAPYDDDQMKSVFQLIVSSFEELADKSSQSYSRRTSILETVAKVRSCVVMLDLECDSLIIEMFQHFLKAIRDYHPENVFSSMETIMTLVLEESEDISVELLSPLLSSVKRDNEDVLPVARKLGEKVLESCATKVKPYLVHAVKTLGISLSDYSDIVASICQETSVTIEQNDAHGADENKVEVSKPVVASSEETAQADKEKAAESASPLQDDLAKSPTLLVSNGVTQTGEDESLADLNSSKMEGDNNLADKSKNVDESSNTEPNTSDAEKVVNVESKPEQTDNKRGKNVDSLNWTEGSESSHLDVEKETQKLPDDNSKNVSISPRGNPSVEAVLSSENHKVTGSKPSSPKAIEGESPTFASPSASESHPDESLSKKAGQQKKKEDLIKASSADDVSEKESEATSDSEAKPLKRARKASSGISVDDTEKSKETGSASESEAKPLKQLSKKIEESSKDGDGSSKKSEEKRLHRRKSISGRGVTKFSAKDVDKEKLPLQMSATKSTKDDHDRLEDTPKTNTKRKSSAGKEKGSVGKEYDESLIGAKVKVWWPKDKTYYEGIIDSFDPVKKKHKVLYNDGDEENLFLKKERWEIIAHELESDEEETADQPSPDASSEMPLRKKAKTSDQSTKKGKINASPKRSGGTSSKSRSVATKTGQKMKEAGKTDGKSTDGSKVEKTKDDNDERSKDHTPKVGGKSTDATSKTASKSKNQVFVTPKSSKSKEDGTSILKIPKSKEKTPTAKSAKSKQDASKFTSDAKGKHAKSGVKADVNGTGKLKSSSSKVKETEDVESSAESDKVQKKRKSATLTKGLESDVKSGKKRRKA